MMRRIRRLWYKLLWYFPMRRNTILTVFMDAEYEGESKDVCPCCNREVKIMDMYYEKLSYEYDEYDVYCNRCASQEIRHRDAMYKDFAKHGEEWSKQE